LTPLAAGVGFGLDLHGAADVAGGADGRAGCRDVPQFPFGQVGGHLGLRQVVRPGGAAAELALLERDELHAGDHPQHVAHQDEDEDIGKQQNDGELVWAVKNCARET